MIVRRVLFVVAAAALPLAAAAPAGAAPNLPHPPSNQGISTACGSVIGHNPNASETGFRQSEQGASNFSAVGEALCFHDGAPD